MFMGHVTRTITPQPPISVKDVSRTVITTEPNVNYLRPVILGSIDGIITSFVIIAGGFAGNVDSDSILVIGFSSLIADAFSMGTGEYLSSRTENTSARSVLKGIACFTSFILMGSIPLLTFMLFAAGRMLASIAAYIICLILIATGQACILKKNVFTTTVEVMSLGCLAGGIAYVVAYVTNKR